MELKCQRHTKHQILFRTHFLSLQSTRHPYRSLRLECDDECRVEQRTRQMALALQIRNPDVSAKLAPRYSEHVRQWAQRDAVFARHVHDKLTELVQLAKKVRQTRSDQGPDACASRNCNTSRLLAMVMPTTKFINLTTIGLSILQTKERTYSVSR